MNSSCYPTPPFSEWHLCVDRRSSIARRLGARTFEETDAVGEPSVCDCFCCCGSTDNCIPYLLRWLLYRCFLIRQLVVCRNGRNHASHSIKTKKKHSRRFRRLSALFSLSFPSSSSSWNGRCASPSIRESWNASDRAWRSLLP